MDVRVLIGSGKDKILNQLSLFLSENGYTVVGESNDGYDFLRRVHTMYPDICIVDFYMKGMNGHEISEVLVTDRISPVVVLMNPSESQHFTNLKHEAYFGAMTKPINRGVMLSTIELLVKSSRSIQKLESEVERLKKQIDDKAVLDRAKRLLMKHMGFDEQEAHRRIQKQSMDKGVSKLKIANAIILTYQD